MAKKMKVTVVVTVYNEEDSVQKLVKSLLRQTKKPDEIIIVDAESRDETVARLQYLISRNKQVKLYVKSGNRSVGRNYGIKKAVNEIIAVTDAGSYPKKDWLQTLVAPFQERQTQIVSGYYAPRAQTSFQKAVAPYFLVMPDKLPRFANVLAQDSLMPDKLDKDVEFLPSSRSVAFRKSVWQKVGGYPEKYSHNEDLVFDYAIKKAGYKFQFAPSAIVYWTPPNSLLNAFKTFYRFAVGDAEARIPRPKVKFIFLRYLLLILLLYLSRELKLVPELILVLILLYLAWAVQKNFRYAKMLQSLFWLPVIQITSDFAIMAGTLYGYIKK